MKNNVSMTRGDLIRKAICFPNISISFKKPKTIKPAKGLVFLTENITCSLVWKTINRRSDNKGLIFGCDFSMKSDALDLVIGISIKMEFRKDISENQLLKTMFFEHLAIDLFQPHLMELVANSTSRLYFGGEPIIIDKIPKPILSNKHSTLHRTGKH